MPTTDARVAPLSMDRLDYELPPERIATRPAEPRDAARLLVVDRSSGELAHRTVRDLPEYLASSDTIVFNTTTVQRCRLAGRRADSGGRVEGLLLGAESSGTLEALLRSNGRLRAGHRIALRDRADRDSGHAIELVEKRGDRWAVALCADASLDVVLATCGRTPLPPYILRARGDAAMDDALDQQWYQTVFADGAAASVAAPTAGLHFTPDLLDRVRATVARELHVILEVGPGTFQPVTAGDLSAHHMHSERFVVPPPTLAALRHRSPGERLIAVGTTTVRTLESLPEPLPPAGEQYTATTDLLIAPGYAFRQVDALLTNFHLPRSTLLALVAAMVGLERLMTIYAEAVGEGYRFYSYGDAMLVV